MTTIHNNSGRRLSVYTDLATEIKSTLPALENILEQDATLLVMVERPIAIEIGQDTLVVRAA